MTDYFFGFKKRQNLIIIDDYDYFPYVFYKNDANDHGNLESFITDLNADYVERDLNTFFADIMFKCQDLSIMIEHADKKAKDEILLR